MLSAQEAGHIAAGFPGFFDAGRTCLVNGTPQSWNPITRSTMELFYVVVDHGRSGMFLFEDEEGFFSRQKNIVRSMSIPHPVIRRQVEAPIVHFTSTKETR